MVCRDDPEMLAEMYLSTANGYKDSPDLRVIWLSNLSQFYKQVQKLLNEYQTKGHLY